MRPPLICITILTLTLLLCEGGNSEATEIFLTNVCFKTIVGCQSQCVGRCRQNRFMTGDCWRIASQHCRNQIRNNLAFVCRCTGYVDAATWPRDYQINQQAKQEAITQEEQQQQQWLLEQQQQQQQQQQAIDQAPPDYGQQFPDYGSQRQQIPDNSPQNSPPEGMQWPPEGMPPGMQFPRGFK